MRLGYGLIIVGWALFATSFFMPVYEWNDGGFSGSDATRWALETGSTFPVLSALTNLLMIMIPIVLCFRNKRVSQIFTFVMLSATALNSWWWIDGYIRDPNFRVGYYMWLVSFGVSTLGLALFVRGLRASESASQTLSIPASGGRGV